MSIREGPRHCLIWKYRSFRQTQRVVWGELEEQSWTPNPMESLKDLSAKGYSNDTSCAMIFCVRNPNLWWEGVVLLSRIG